MFKICSQLHLPLPSLGQLVSLQINHRAVEHSMRDLRGLLSTLDKEPVLGEPVWECFLQAAILFANAFVSGGWI